jgi:hypothetical protein
MLVRVSIMAVTPSGGCAGAISSAPETIYAVSPYRIRKNTEGRPEAHR